MNCHDSFHSIPIKMNKFISRLKYHFQQFFFEYYAVPKVINEKISKSVLLLTAVDCVKYSTICNKMNIRAYPTMKAFNFESGMYSDSHICTPMMTS